MLREESSDTAGATVGCVTTTAGAAVKCVGTEEQMSGAPWPPHCLPDARGFRSSLLLAPDGTPYANVA